MIRSSLSRPLGASRSSCPDVSKTQARPALLHDVAAFGLEPEEVLARRAGAGIPPDGVAARFEGLRGADADEATADVVELERDDFALGEAERDLGRRSEAWARAGRTEPRTGAIRDFDARGRCIALCEAEGDLTRVAGVEFIGHGRASGRRDRVDE